MKAGFDVKFYPVDKTMTSVFSPDVIDEISVLSICGYYGFSRYDRDFVKCCKERGVIIMEDMTHSVLSRDGLEPLCDYAAGSLRKWIGVACGGFALKIGGKFGSKLNAPHIEHLRLRYEAIEENSDEKFWAGEKMLRRVFGDFGSDLDSVHIMTHFDVEDVRRKRRENYRTLLEQVVDRPEVRIVFKELDDDSVPSHFTFYAENRDSLRSYLSGYGIKTKVYWPIPPQLDLQNRDLEQVAYIYEHVTSVMCDQRFTPHEMTFLAEKLNSYK